MGGSVACHIARNCKVEFLFADRTFSKLTDVPLISFGKLARWMFLGLTCFNDDVAADFIEAKCYKIVGWDPEDTIINELCSLKLGVSQKIVEIAKNFNNKKFKFNNYFHILSQEEGEAFKKSVKYLLELNKKMQILKHNWEDENNDSMSKDEDIHDEGSEKSSPEMLHQSQLHDIENNKLEDSIYNVAKDHFNNSNHNNSVMIDKINLDNSVKLSKKFEYLETYRDADPDLDDKFFQITNPGVFESSLNVLLNNKLSYK